MSNLTEKQIADLFIGAPDDCLGAVQYKDGRCGYEHGIFVTKTKGFMEDGYHYCGYTNIGPVMGCFDFIPRPEPKQLYTQSMKDNNQPLELGMGFSTEINNIYYAELINDKSVCFTDEDGFLVTTSINSIKPVHMPLELIDGEPYMFRLNGQLIGFYRKDRKSFFTELHGGNKICGETEPSKITALIGKGES